MRPGDANETAVCWIAVAARADLEDAGIATRVVSMPCVEWFTAGGRAYRDTVLPLDVQARVSVEAGITTGWERFVRDSGRSVGLDHFGASADAVTLYERFGITAGAVAEAARCSIADARVHSNMTAHRP